MITMFGRTEIEILEGLKLLDEKKKPKYVTIEHCGGVDRKTCTVSVREMIEALRRIDIICIEKAPEPKTILVNEGDKVKLTLEDSNTGRRYEVVDAKVIAIDKL